MPIEFSSIIDIFKHIYGCPNSSVNKFSPLFPAVLYTSESGLEDHRSGTRGSTAGSECGFRRVLIETVAGRTDDDSGCPSSRMGIRLIHGWLSKSSDGGALTLAI